MSTERDAELLALYRKGYCDWWRSDEAKTDRYSGEPRRDHAAGLRAVAEAAWDECLDAIEKHELNTEQARIGNPYRPSVTVDKETKK